MRIPRKVREEAALLCALMASSNELLRGGSVRAPVDFKEPCDALGINCHTADSAALAREAYWYLGNHEEQRANWAEAESLLRCGFVPEGWE